MKTLDKYKAYLKNQSKTLEGDDITRKIITEYYEEKLLEKEWRSVLDEEYNFSISDPADQDTSINTNNKEINKKRLFIVALTGIAASLLLFFFVNSPTGSIPLSPLDQMLSAHYEKPFARDVLKGPSSTLEIRSQAYQFYQEKNYTETIKLLEDLMIKGGQEQEDFFYLGLCYLYRQQPEKAEKQFKTLLASPNNNYQDIATWYLALALTDAEKFDEAKIYLSEVATWNGNSGQEELANDALDLIQVIELDSN